MKEQFPLEHWVGCQMLLVSRVFIRAKISEIVSEYQIVIMIILRTSDTNAMEKYGHELIFRSWCLPMKSKQALVWARDHAIRNANANYSPPLNIQSCFCAIRASIDRLPKMVIPQQCKTDGSTVASNTTWATTFLPTAYAILPKANTSILLEITAWTYRRGIGV